MDNNSEVLNYLKSRGVHDHYYFEKLVDKCSKYTYKLCTTNSYEFMFSHLLDGSNRVGYNLIKVNHYLQTAIGNNVAIGVVDGDDVICIDTRDGSINLWLIENGNGDHIKIATDFAHFWQMVAK